MNSSVSVWSCLVTFALMAQLYSAYRQHFSGVDFYAARQQLFERQYAQEKLRHELTRFEFDIFRQDVAAILVDRPELRSTKERDYPVRKLASATLRPDSSRFAALSSRTRFNEAKASFRAGKYEKAERQLQEFVERFSFSIHAVEAYFLMAESAFRLRHYDRAARAIESMVTLFPANEMTGFGLVRLGQIFEAQERQQEAADLYRTVLQSFRDPQVVLQARQALGALQ